MRDGLRFLSLFALIFAEVMPASAQWVQTNGPYGGVVTCMISNDSILFAGTFMGGVFRSTDEGRSWLAVNDGFFRSTNGGAKWNDSMRVSVSVSTLTNARYLSLCMSGDNLFAATNLGLYVSGDGGLSWSEVDSGITRYISSLASDGRYLLASADDGRVFVSRNSGRSWTEVGSGLSKQKVRCVAVSDTVLFAGTYAGLYRSSDNGESWSAVRQGLKGEPVICFDISGKRIFVGARSGVYLSTDRGGNWTRVDWGMSGFHVGSLMVIGTSLFAGTSGQGVWRRSLSEMNEIRKRLCK